jgi:Secretion system C-terminal sorting domain/IPT/TIG domain
MTSLRQHIVQRSTLAIAFLLTICFHCSYAQVWQANSYGNPHAAVLNVISHNGKLYLATSYAGFYVSSDDGATWNQFTTTQLPDGSAIRMMVSSGSALIGDSYSGIWLSMDDGATWAKKYTTGTIQTYASNGSVVLAARDNDVLRSNDGGETWDQTAIGQNVRHLAFSATAAYALTSDGDIFKSTDSGVTWVKKYHGSYFYAANGLGANGTFVYATFFNGLAVSGDNGDTWWIKTPPVMATTFGFNGTDLIAGGLEKVYVSHDNGATFEATPILEIGNGGTASILVQGGKVIVATAISGIYTSGTAAYSFVQSNEGLIRPAIYGIAVRGNNIVTTSFGSVHHTADGITWLKSTTDFTGMHIMQVVAMGNSFFASTLDNGVFVSTDDGATWTPASTGLTSLSTYDITTSGANVIVASDDGIFVSSNNGAAWTNARSGAVNRVIKAGNRVFATTFPGVVLMSDSNGSTWVTTDLTQGQFLFDIVELAGITYASTSHGMFKSTNGLNWTEAPEFSKYFISEMTSDGTSVYFFDQNTYQVHKFSGASAVNLQFYATFSSARLLVNNDRLYTVANSYASNILLPGSGSIWSRSVSGLIGISSISPLSGPAGTVITIAGQGFSALPLENVVTIGGIRATVLHTSPTQLTVAVPNVAGPQPIEIRRSTYTAISVPRFVATPVATSLEPAIALVGQSVAINGSGFGAASIVPEVRLNGILTNSTAVSRSVISFIVPDGAQSGTVTLKIGAYTTSLDIQVSPTITEIYPSEGVAGDVVSVRGTGFSSLPAQNVVHLNGEIMPLVGSGTSGLTFKVPSAATSGIITVTANGLAAYSNSAFLVRPSSAFCPTPPSAPIITEIPGAPSGIVGLVSSTAFGNQWYFNGAKIPGATDQVLITDQSGQFSVTTTVDGCTSEKSIEKLVTVVITGIEDHGTLNIYPNPVNDVLQIDLTNETVPSGILIYSASGRSMLNTEASAGTVLTVDTSGFSSGLYVLQVHNSNATIVRKFEKR